MAVELSYDQETAVAAIEDWYRSGEPEIRFGGLAGTGKTTIAALLPERLGLLASQVAFCAFTGRAARVLSTKLSGAEATTIHGLIYKPHEVHCVDCPTSRDENRTCHRKRLLTMKRGGWVG